MLLISSCAHVLTRTSDAIWQPCLRALPPGNPGLEQNIQANFIMQMQLACSFKLCRSNNFLFPISLYEKICFILICPGRDLNSDLCDHKPACYHLSHPCLLWFDVSEIRTIIHFTSTWYFFPIFSDQSIKCWQGNSLHWYQISNAT